MPRPLAALLTVALAALVTGYLAVPPGAVPPGAGAADGRVTDAAGRPLPGVTVTARRADGVVAYSVVTGADGRFVFEGLPAGPYALRARRIGYEDAAQAGFDPVAAAPVALALAPRADVFGQVPASALLAHLPDGEAKRAFVLDCTGCHQFDQRQVAPGGALRSRASWEERTRQMLSFAGASSGFPIMAPSRDAEATADWLVAHLGDAGGALPAVAAPPPMTGADAAFAVTEYAIPDPDDLPHDLMPDGRGRLLITGMMTSRMYVLDPATGAFETVATPGGGARALDVGPDGTWWVLLGNARRIAAYDPAAGTWRTWDVGLYPHDILRDARGRIWFNGHFSVDPELLGVLDPATGAIRTFEVPAPPMPDGGSTIPYGMRLGPDGAVWMTQLRGNRLVRFDPATETFALYPLPTPDAGPRRPALAPDGAVWIPGYAANTLHRFDPATETFRTWALPIPDALPYVVRVDPGTGEVWVATGAADAVLRFRPETETWVVHRLPTPRALVRHMELDPGGRGAWVAYGNSPAVDPRVALIRPLPVRP